MRGAIYEIDFSFGPFIDVMGISESRRVGANPPLHLHIPDYAQLFANRSSAAPDRGWVGTHPSRVQAPPY